MISTLCIACMSPLKVSSSSMRARPTLAVCTGTACHVKGNDRILAWAREQFGLSPGETTPDNRLSLVEVRCVGACALAPVIVTDGEIRGKKSFAESTAMIGEWLGDAGR